MNYAFFFWLPFYLHSNFKWDESEANKLSAWYDFGGIVGSVVGGIISVSSVFVENLKISFLGPHWPSKSGHHNNVSQLIRPVDCLFRCGPQQTGQRYFDDTARHHNLRTVQLDRWHNFC